MLLPILAVSLLIQVAAKGQTSSVHDRQIAMESTVTSWR